LSHRPADWREALTHHEWVLNANPCQVASLRTLLRVARERGNRQAVATGLGIARALGIGSPLDREVSPGELAVAPRYAGNGELAQPLWEKLRQLVHECSDELAEALGASSSHAPLHSSDPVAAFHAAALAAEGRLTAAALLPLSGAELEEVMLLIAAIALEIERAHGDGRVVNAVASAIKRRLRRRLRRHIQDASIEEIESVDFGAWRANVRALAAAIAVEETGIELRTALIALLRDSADRRAEPIPDGADLCAWVSESPAASALLRQAIRSWLGQLA
jgi:hypothetical protein